MEAWLNFAKGPLFTAAFLTMILGLGRLVLLQSHALLAKKQRLRLVPWKRVFTETLSWAFPVRHMIPGTIVISSASFLFHFGAIIVPLFLADHTERDAGGRQHFDHGLGDVLASGIVGRGAAHK